MGIPSAVNRDYPWTKYTPGLGVDFSAEPYATVFDLNPLTGASSGDLLIAGRYTTAAANPNLVLSRAKIDSNDTEVEPLRGDWLGQITFQGRAMGNPNNVYSPIRHDYAKIYGKVLDHDDTTDLGAAGQVLLETAGGITTFGPSYPTEWYSGDDNTDWNGNFIEVSSTGDAGIILNADSDNSTENDNAFIAFGQDGTAVRSYLGTCGDTNKSPINEDFSGVLSNATLLGTSGTYGHLQIGTNNQVQMTFREEGGVSIGSHYVQEGVPLSIKNAVYSGPDQWGQNRYNCLQLRPAISPAQPLSHDGNWAVLVDEESYITDPNAGNAQWIGDGAWGLRFASRATDGSVTSYTLSRQGGTQANLNFTGQHRCLPAVGLISDYADKVGMIVESSGQYAAINPTEEKGDITIDDALPKVGLCKVENNPAVFGVISSVELDDQKPRSYEVGGIKLDVTKNDARLVVNSVGEGAMWVTNYAGDLSNGDYISSSPVEGHGMKQADDLLHNYTVAKVTMPCSFDLNSPDYQCEEIIHAGQAYRRAFVGVTYHCG